MKRRIVRRYHPLCGTWWVVQEKLWWWWITSPMVFDTYEDACRGIFFDDDELFENPVETIEKITIPEK